MEVQVVTLLRLLLMVQGVEVQLVLDKTTIKDNKVEQDLMEILMVLIVMEKVVILLLVELQQQFLVQTQLQE
jgi:hypothetical protein